MSALRIFTNVVATVRCDVTLTGSLKLRRWCPVECPIQFVEHQTKETDSIVEHC